MDDLMKRVAAIMEYRPELDLKLQEQTQPDAAGVSVVATPLVAKPSPSAGRDDGSIVMKPVSSTSTDNADESMPTERGDGDMWPVVNEVERVMGGWAGRKMAVRCATCGEPFTPKRPWGKL